LGRNETMKDLFEAGFTKDQVLDALRQLPFVSWSWNLGCRS
jgi:hypothetical protein